MAKTKTAKKAAIKSKITKKPNKAAASKKSSKPMSKSPVAKARPKSVAAKPAAKPQKAALKTANNAPANSNKGAAAKTPQKSATSGIKMIDSKSIMAKSKINPAQAAKMADPLFAANDFVVYPTHGVGQVKGVETQEIAGYKLKLFVIEIEGAKMVIKVPVNKANAVGLRRLSTRKEMGMALDKLKIRARVRRTMWSRRAQEYETKINSGNPTSIAEVVRELYRSSTQPDQSYSERQIYQSALDRLSRELAAVERLDEQAAIEKIENILKAA